MTLSQAMAKTSYPVGRAARRRRLVRSVVLCAFLLGGVLVLTGADDQALAAGETLHASGGQGYSPYHFVREGESMGFDVDLLRAVARAAGLDVEIELLPWQEARVGMAGGTIQVHVGMTISAERRNLFNFTTPHLSQQYRIFVRDGNRSIRSEGDLQGRLLVVQRDGVMANYVVDKGFTVEPLEVDSALEALRLVSEGKAEACLMSELRGLHVAREGGLKNLHRVGEPVYQTSYSFAVTADRPDLVPRLNQGLAIVKASGEYDRIYDQWFGVLEDRRPAFREVLRYAAWVILPLLALALLSLLWTWSLRRQVLRQTVDLAEARDAAEAASQAKSRFLTTMSHEVRTPLNAVLGMAQVLESSDLTPDQRDGVETIISSGVALEGVLSGILEFSSIEAGKRRLKEDEFSPAQLFHDTVNMVRWAAGEKGLEVRLEGLENLPGRLIGDAEALRQVMLNLLGNAVKFTEKGWVCLGLKAEQADDHSTLLTVTVQDTGIGISPQDAERLFEAFTQSDSSDTRRFGGMGLGLAICTSLVRLMGGRLSVQPGPEGGSEFRLQVRLRRAAGSHEPAPVEGSGSIRDAASSQEIASVQESPAGRKPAKASVPRPAPRKQQLEMAGGEQWSPDGLRVLLVEDNPLNQRMMCLLLEQEGVTIELAANGQEALDVWSPGAFDAIIMDCQMPVMDGFQATVELRQREEGHQRVPIIALTAGALESDRDRCLAVGMDDFLTKPVDGSLLFTTLHRWCSGAATQPTGS